VTKAVIPNTRQNFAFGRETRTFLAKNVQWIDEPPTLDVP
jgi:hypothetical protein